MFTPKQIDATQHEKQVLENQAQYKSCLKDFKCTPSSDIHLSLGMKYFPIIHISYPLVKIFEAEDQKTHNSNVY